MLSRGTYVTVSIKGIMDTVTEFTATRTARKYRRRTTEEKRRIVEETLSSDRSVAEIARAHEVNANQVFDWRRQYQEGRLSSTAPGDTFLPVIVHDPGDSATNGSGTGHQDETRTSGRILIQLPRGEIHIEGRPDPDALRVVIECLSR
jgi:transposase